MGQVEAAAAAHLAVYVSPGLTVGAPPAMLTPPGIMLMAKSRLFFNTTTTVSPTSAWRGGPAQERDQADQASRNDYDDSRSPTCCLLLNKVFCPAACFIAGHIGTSASCKCWARRAPNHPKSAAEVLQDLLELQMTHPAGPCAAQLLTLASTPAGTEQQRAATEHRGTTRRVCAAAGPYGVLAVIAIFHDCTTAGMTVLLLRAS